MIQCKTAREWLPLLDPDANDRDPRRRQELEEHLKQCSECRKYQTEEAQLRKTLLQAGNIHFSQEYLQDFTVRLNQSIDSNGKSKAWLRHWLRRLEASPLPTLAQAAAVVWLVMIVIIQFPGVGAALLQAIGMQ